MIQDEAGQRYQKNYGARLRRVGFRGDKTLENLEFELNPVSTGHLSGYWPPAVSSTNASAS